MIKIPYTFKIVLPVIGWGFLCSFFAYTLILTVVNINGNFLIYRAPIYFFLFALFLLLRYGLGMFYEKEVKVINKNIDSDLKEELSLKEVKETLKSLVNFCKNLYLFSFAGGLILVAGATLGISLNYGTLQEFIIVLISGLTGLFFFASFSLFFSQQVIFQIIKKCREILSRSGENTDDIILSSIKSKFYFLFIFPFFAVLIVVVCVYPIDYKTIILAIIGLVMSLIIGRVLYVYVYRSFSEIERFSGTINKKDKSVFVVGSLDKEFVDLANNFNKLSFELSSLKKDSEKSKKEMEKRVEELEKFFKLTIDRETKMVELKKEIKKLKNV
jgi:methyl-accepting chemotaxis protein